jgi:hypothetical protein
MPGQRGLSGAAMTGRKENKTEISRSWVILFWLEILERSLRKKGSLIP